MIYRAYIPPAFKKQLRELAVWAAQNRYSFDEVWIELARMDLELDLEGMQELHDLYDATRYPKLQQRAAKTTKRAAKTTRRETMSSRSFPRRSLNEPRKDVPIDARIIFIDEMDHIGSEYLRDNHIVEIGSVYLYDANSYTYIASTQPTYFLHFLYPRVVFDPDYVATLDEREFDLIRDEVEYDMHAAAEDDYFGVSEIDQLAKTLSKGDYYVVGKTGISYDEESEEEQMEDLLEYYRGNHMI